MKKKSFNVIFDGLEITEDELVEVIEEGLGGIDLGSQVWFGFTVEEEGS